MYTTEDRLGPSPAILKQKTRNNAPDRRPLRLSSQQSVLVRVHLPALISPTCHSPLTEVS